MSNFSPKKFNTLKNRVVITGVGSVNPIGNRWPETFLGLTQGKSGIARITLFDPKDCATQIAGEVKNFDPTKTFESPLFPRGKDGVAVQQAIAPKDLRRMDRFIQLALVAGCEAYQDSGLDQARDQISPEEIGVNIGCGMGGLPGIEDTYNTYLEKGIRRISPFFIPQVIPNLAAGQLSILLNTQNTNLCSVSACASSAHSIGESFRAIQRGDATVMLAGGTEAVVCALGIGGFAAMKALSSRNETPETASRPFHPERDGFVMGEGAAVLVMENIEFALARGAKIYAEIVGFGATSDAFHLTQPLEDGSGGYRAMKAALEDASLKPHQIQYVNAHGTSTPLGDLQEVKAIERLFSETKAQLFVSSTKSMTGHLLGAAGALEALATISAIQHQKIPPTINLDQVDPEIEKLKLNLTPNHAIEKPIDAALSNSFGFGGTNVSLAFRKYSA